MSNILLDGLTLNRIEREIGRKLTKEEIHDARYSGQIFLRKDDGELVGFEIDRYRLPYDLLSDSVDLSKSAKHNEDFFSTVSENIETPDEF